jgi:hypothetical protein
MASKFPAAYETAKAGGKHSGIIEVYRHKSINEIRRAQRSYLQQVVLHLHKIESPEQFIEEWDKLSSTHQRGLLKKWERDQERNQELADVMRGLLMEYHDEDAN